MDLLNKLTIKNLKLNKKRTIVTIIGIILSVALITAVASMYMSVIKSLIKYEKFLQGDFHVAYFNVPKEEIENFKNNRGIEKIYLSKNIGYAKLEKSKNKNKPYAYIKALTKDSLENLSIKLVEGRLPENTDEIMIPTHLKTNGRIVLNIGDSITLDVGKRISLVDNVELDQGNPYQSSDYLEEKINDKTGKVNESEEKIAEDIVNTTAKTYKIVGIIQRPASNLEEYSAPGYTFVTYMNEDDISGNVDIYAKYTKKGLKDNYKITANILGVNEESYAKINSGKRISNNEIKQIQQELEKAKYQIDTNEYLIQLETNPFKDSSAGGLGSVVIIVCIIIVFTSIFCIRNSFDISITEKIKQYGILKSIGATKKQIKKNVLYEATILGAIGIPLGILFGLLASYILIIVSNVLLNIALVGDIKLIFAFSWVAIAIAIILGIVTIYLSAIRSAIKSSKIEPITAIRNSANIKIKKIKSPKIINKLFGIGGVISYKNLSRNKKKYRTTVISIVVSVSVFIALFSFMDMSFDSIKDQINLQDYNMYLSMTMNEENYEKALETTKLDSIEDYTICQKENIYIKETKYYKKYIEKISGQNEKVDSDGVITIMALGDEPYQKYVKSLGVEYDEIKDKAILINNVKFGLYDENEKYVEYQMKEFDYKKGETIKTKNNKKEMDFQIGLETEKRPFGFQNSNSSMLIVSNQVFDSYIECNRVEVYYKSSNADKLQDDIEEALKGIDYNLNNSEENAKTMNNLFILIGIFLYGFIIVISLIGITNIFNTITTNMELRRQEFAMLKSIGMTNQEFSKMIRLESIFMGTKSLIFGILIGTGLSYLIYHYLAENQSTYKLPILAIVIAIVAVLLLISEIMRYSLQKINKQNTIETIRNENI